MGPASEEPGGPRVLVWDVVSLGHHRRYLEAVVRTAPEGYRLLLPYWTPSDLAASAGSEVEVLPPPEGDDEWRSFKRTIEQTRPDGVILMEAHRLVRWLALRRAPDPGALLAVDMHVRDGVFGNPRAYRHGLPPRLLAAALASWLAHELVVRRYRAGFVRLNGWADRVGTRRLRRQTAPLLDPIEHLPLADPRAKLRPTLISLVGVLYERKGLDLLVAALEQLTAHGRIDPDAVAVAVAGTCRPGYEPELDRLMTRLERAGFGTDVETGNVSPETLSGLLAATDVLVLPYRSHFGSSGFLGTAFDFPQLTVVCSDFGWLGHIAGHAGAILFRNRSVGDLARALESALTERPTVDVERRIGYAEPEAFGRLIWSSLPPLA